MTRPTKPHYEKTFFKVLYTPRIFELGARLSRFLGRGICAGGARMIAWCYAVTQGGTREIVRRNLALLTTEPASARDAIAVFTSYGATLADYVAIGSMDPAEAEKLCVARDGIEHLEEALRHGRGAILATGHFGFFEFGALLLGRMGFPVTIVTLPEHTAELTEWRAAFRRRWGAETIEIGTDAFSSLRVIGVLDRGGFAAMLADRPAGDRTVPIDLPNGRIHFSQSPALLAHMADCPVIPVTIARRHGGYRIHSGPCVWPRRFAGTRDECVRAATVGIARALVADFQRDPSQWYHFVPIGIAGEFVADSLQPRA